MGQITRAAPAARRFSPIVTVRISPIVDGLAHPLTATLDVKLG
jgi:hypothetical protein